MIPPCDCLNRCGDDPRVLRGQVQTCPRWREWISRPRIVEVSRHPTCPHQVVLQLTRPATDKLLKALENFDHWPWPQ